MRGAGSLPWPLRTFSAVVHALLALLTRREYRNVSKLPRQGGYILVANHLCSFDAVTLLDLTLRNGIIPRIAARHTLWNVPLLGWAMRYMRHIPVQRGAGKGEQVVDAFCEAIEDGGILVVFPEGTTTADPDYWPMTGKTGVAKVALRTRCPIIPIAQWGNQYFLPRYSYVPRIFSNPRLQLRVLDPVNYDDLTEYSHDNVVALTDRIMATIRAGVGELRGETPPPLVYDMRLQGSPWESEPHRQIRRIDRKIIRNTKKRDRHHRRANQAALKAKNHVKDLK
ncbi:lysophospholipid acyltransferase family protein [Boudabousia marimammalium]|uniref:Phospholipid/glycerol acyltransferase domain-containing protein n=1 Tax=Boudabousia marimammalium TaxID=156892 RepID=A0A1Q5PPB7_9ACTO|nr:lysophospholipid acyltransferase family protein [Boudabousia marimammalium]OKL49362.1 hypothetical protein BM477_05140 [Boudabousia marimammalium]